MNEKQILFSYDRKRTSTLTLDSQPGAHTGASRKYIPGYTSANIVYLDTVSGNDANGGTSPADAKLTYSAAATAAGSTKKIRLVNSATLTDNITKPTEATIGTTSSITSASLTAPVNVWTQSGTTPYTGGVWEIIWISKVKRWYASTSLGGLAYSLDGDTWVVVSSPGIGSTNIYGIAWSGTRLVVTGSDGAWYSDNLSTFTAADVTAFGGTQLFNVVWVKELEIFVATANNGKIGISEDGESWQLSPDAGFGNDAVRMITWSPELSLLVAVGYAGKIAYSSDGISWTQAATPSFGSDDINSVAWAVGILKFIAVAGSGKIAYSSDGNTWTQAGTPSFGASTVLDVEWAHEISKAIAVGSDGKIAYSSDGNVWTQAGTPSYGATAIEAVSWSPLLYKAVSADSSGNAAYSTALGTTISNHIAGFSVSAVLYSGTLTAYNCSFQYLGTTAALTTDSCRIEYDSHISSNSAKSLGSLYRGDRHTTCTPASIYDIDMSLDTIGGVWYIYNASATGFERIRDCLAVGGIVANYNVTVSGRANVSGTSTNVLFDSQVTHNTVSFVDTTDYKLEFQTNGYAKNSFAVGRSNIYFNSAGDRRDIGAWSYIESAVSYYYAKNAILYRGEVTHGTEFQLNEQQGDSGVVSVYGNTRRVKEVLTITYGSTAESERTIFDYMLTLQDKTVKVQIDPEWDSNPGTVTVDGNQSAGVEFLTVDSTATYNGMWLTISGKQYFVMRASPNTTAATKLILDRPTEDAVTDNQEVTRNYPLGAGEYQFAGPVNLTLKRVAPTGLRGYQTGFAIRLVRKKQ